MCPLAELPTVGRGIARCAPTHSNRPTYRPYCKRACCFGLPQARSQAAALPPATAGNRRAATPLPRARALADRTRSRFAFLIRQLLTAAAITAAQLPSASPPRMSPLQPSTL
eukprot:365026-Chlamydomonas_euryale.AAC.4